MPAMTHLGCGHSVDVTQAFDALLVSHLLHCWVREQVTLPMWILSLASSAYVYIGFIEVSFACNKISQFQLYNQVLTDTCILSHNDLKQNGEDFSSTSHSLVPPAISV